jgi:two-component system, NarL family, response regulator DevR
MVDPATPVTSERSIRVFIVDDHELVRRGLTDLLTATDDLIIVGEAATANDALHRIPAAAPDVALLDARLPDGSGIDVCREIRSSQENVRCLILTSFDDDEALFAAVMAGASGYLLKQIGGNSLVEGIRQVAAGRSLLDPAVTEKLLHRLRNPVEPDPLAGSLTAREREILDLIADGCTNRQIGERLFLAEKTVKNYVSGLLTKLGMQTADTSGGVRSNPAQADRRHASESLVKLPTGAEFLAQGHPSKVEFPTVRSSWHA